MSNTTVRRKTVAGNRPEPNVYEEISNEIHTGPFSILSEKATDRLLLLVQRAMSDGYQRGYDAGFDHANENHDFVL